MKSRREYQELKFMNSLNENKEKAKAYLDDDEKMEKLFRDFEDKLKLIPKIGNRASDIAVLLSLVRAYIKKQYTDEAIAAEMGMSSAKLNRLMKLSEATRQICDLVDDNTIPLSVAYNIAFLQPKHQDTVADLIGINVKVNNENTGILKKVAASENLTEQKIRDVLEGKYPPKIVEKPKTVTSPTTVVPTPPAMAPVSVPKTPDIPVPPVPPAQPKATDNVVPFPSTGAAPTQGAPSTTPGKEAAPAAIPPKPAAEPQDRENSYETKIVLRGDRLRKYFPDVSMTPREIEDSVYDALEMRRQMQEKAKQKAELFGKEKKGPVK